MSWTAIVPVKSAGERKSRLTPRLSSADRVRLADRLLDHVVAVLRVTPRIAGILLLSPERPAGWPERWRPDEGRGLNAELDAAIAAAGRPALVLHGDLPLLAPEDVTALLDAGEEAGLALAPDRHGQGTNALALADERAFACRFGPGSFAAHVTDANGRWARVDRLGLALDCDSPDDLDAALEAGFRLG